MLSSLTLYLGYGCRASDDERNLCRVPRQRHAGQRAFRAGQGLRCDGQRIPARRGPREGRAHLMTELETAFALLSTAARGVWREVQRRLGTLERRSARN